MWDEFLDNTYIGIVMLRLNVCYGSEKRVTDVAVCQFVGVSMDGSEKWGLV